MKKISKLILPVLAFIAAYFIFKSNKKTVGADSPSPYNGNNPFNNDANIVAPTNGELAGDPNSEGKNNRDKIESLIDTIFVKLNGMNMRVYPEYVNRIANLSKNETWWSLLHWMEKYKPINGESLYEFIQNETGDHVYSPALSHIKRLKWHTK
jgi:hypothetical protein